MLLSNASQLELNLTGYGLSVFFIVLGLLFYFYFSNKIAYIGIPLIVIGLLFLSVQLDTNNQSGFALFVGGLIFLSPQLYLKNKSGTFAMIVSFLVLSFSITFFFVAGLYMFYQSDQSSSLFSLVEEFINFAMALFTLVRLIKEVINYKSKKSSLSK